MDHLKKYITAFLLFIVAQNLWAQNGKILFFISQENTYYSEYIVMKEALNAAGYTVDVRSATINPASTYMANSDIAATANSLAGSTYSDFQTQFLSLFGATWNASLNTIPANIPVNGKIQEVTDISEYKALVIAGGTGILNYRVDGSYAGHGSATASDVQTAAEKLNALGLSFMQSGKPVLAQCHGASIPVFWRIPSTSGAGAEALGYSFLKDHQAAGYPEAQTATTLADFYVQYKAADRVTVSSPHSSLNDNGKGRYKIITSRDWFPQTIAYAARTLLNVIETYPGNENLSRSKSVLILHGGALDPGNCNASNHNNDVPCNYGGGANLPADYTAIQNLLTSVSANDSFSFNVSDLNISGALPYNDNVQSEILAYLNNYDVVIFFKHWSLNVSNNLQNALVSYADQGGGVLGLHHGLYNNIDGSFNKNILVNQLFGAQSSSATWSASLANYNLFETNYGHFISTYGLDLPNSVVAPSAWNTNSPDTISNLSFSTYSNFPIYDEVYNNMSFVAGQTFGRSINDITPLLSNDRTPSAQCHTSGFVKLFDNNSDCIVGKVCYMEPGERNESINISQRYGQVIRNAAAWLARDTNIVEFSGPTTFCAGDSVILTARLSASYLWNNNDTTQSITVKSAGTYYVSVTDIFGCTKVSSPVDVVVNCVTALPTITAITKLNVYPNPTNGIVHINGFVSDCKKGKIILRNIIGQVIYEEDLIIKNSTIETTISIAEFRKGIYFMTIETENGSEVMKISKLD
jgi:putative intracellular protease/amidase